MMQYINQRNYFFTPFLLLISLLCHPYSAWSAEKANTTPTGKIFGVYYASYANAEQVQQIPWELVTHVFYAFAGITKDNTCGFVTDLNDPSPESPLPESKFVPVIAALEQARAKYNPKVKLILSVGGQTMSYRFSTATSKSASKLAASCVALAKQYGFDGIDYDWEYPTRYNYGNCPSWVKNCDSKNDIKNFTSLLKNTRKGLGSQKVLTIAVNHNLQPIAEQIPYDVPNMDAQLSFWNVMTYEFGGSWSQGTALNAPTDQTVSALEGFVKRGATPSKLVMGVPYYSKIWHHVEKDTGIGSSGSGGDDTEPFDQVNDQCSRDQDCKIHHLDVGGYCYCSDSKNWYSFDDATVMSQKAYWVNLGGYAGMMAWVVPGDTAGMQLSKAIAIGLGLVH